MILSQRDCCNITASGTKMSNTHCWVEQLCSHRPIAGEGPGLPSTQVTIQTDRCRRFEKKKKKKDLTDSFSQPLETPTRLRSLSYPNVWLTSLTRSALCSGGMYSQDATAIRLEMRTSRAMRRSWEGWNSHRSGPSLATSFEVILEKLSP